MVRVFHCQSCRLVFKIGNFSFRSPGGWGEGEYFLCARCGTSHQIRYAKYPKRTCTLFSKPGPVFEDFSPETLNALQEKEKRLQAQYRNWTQISSQRLALESLVVLCLGLPLTILASFYHGLILLCRSGLLCLSALPPRQTPDAAGDAAGYVRQGVCRWQSDRYEAIEAWRCSYCHSQGAFRSAFRAPVDRDDPGPNDPDPIPSLRAFCPHCRERELWEMDATNVCILGNGVIYKFRGPVF